MSLVVKIRKVEDKDIASITEGFRQAYLPLYKAQHLSQENIDGMNSLNNEEHFRKRIKGNYFFAAEIKNKIIGVIGLRKDDNSDIYNRVSTFFVLDKYQGQGIGSLLFNKVLDLAIDLNIRKLVVSSSVYAESIYKHWGFKKIKVIIKNYPDGSKYKNIWMEKKI